MSEKSNSNQTDQGSEAFSITDELLMGFHDDFLDETAIEDDLINTELPQPKPVIDLETKEHNQELQKKSTQSQPDKPQVIKKQNASQGKVVNFNERTATEAGIDVDELTQNLERLESQLEKSEKEKKQAAASKATKKPAENTVKVNKAVQPTAPVVSQPAAVKVKQQKEEPKTATAPAMKQTIKPDVAMHHQQTVTQPVKEKKVTNETSQQSPTAPSDLKEKNTVSKSEPVAKEESHPSKQSKPGKNEQATRTESHSQQVSVTENVVVARASSTPSPVTARQPEMTVILAIISLLIGAGAAWFAYSATQGISSIHSSLQEIKALKGPDINQNPQFVALSDQVNQTNSRIDTVTSHVSAQVVEVNQRIANVTTAVTTQTQSINKQITSVSTVVADLENKLSNNATTQNEAINQMSNRMQQFENVIAALESKIDTLSITPSQVITKTKPTSQPLTPESPAIAAKSTPTVVVKPVVVAKAQPVKNVVITEPVAASYIKELVSESKAVISKWVLNMLSYKHQADAEKMLTRLQNTGMENLEITYFEKSGKHWYRIRMSGFESREEAIAMIPDLPKGFHIDSAWAGRY